MEKGRAEVHGTVGGFLVFGFSLQDLYWYDEARTKKSRRGLINSGDARIAFACKACGFVTIDMNADSASQRRRRVRRERFNRLKGRLRPSP